MCDNMTTENLQIQIEEMEKKLKEKKLNIEIERIFEKYNVRRGNDKSHRWKLDYHNKTIRKTHAIDMYHYILENIEPAMQVHTIDDVFSKWIDRKMTSGEITSSTAERYEDDFNAYFKGSRIAGRDIGMITEDDIEDFIDDLKSLRMPVKRFSGVKTILRGMWKYAKKEKWTKLSITYVLEDIEVSKKCFKKTENTAETQVYSKEELRKIIDFCHNAPDNSRIKNCQMKRLAIAVAAGTGVRISELAALRFSDINYKEGYIELQRSEHREIDKVNGGYRYFIGDPKTEAGARRIYVSDEVLNDIMTLREMPHETDYLFELDGDWMKSFNFDREIRRICEKLDIPVRSMHKVRKTYSTALIDSGVEQSLIISQMGHTDIQTTMRSYYYDNVDEEKKRKKVLQAVNY